MRHQKAGRKFGRNTSHRRAMLRNLAGNLVLNERIKTTDAKAKELRRVAERLITRAVRLGDDLTVDVGTISDDAERQRVVARRVHAQREVAKFLPRELVRTSPDGEVEEVDLIHKLFHEIAPRYVERAKAGKGGGYTRIMKLYNRRGDNAPVSVIELLGSEAPLKGRKAPTVAVPDADDGE
ncbi:MAG: 50S ribosomal protein L17 [Myxococcales bacterium]|nr:50S ribosomal protein L17 [Myxococcales bacterium]